MAVELKEKYFKTIIRSGMAYGSECWRVKQNDESKQIVAVLKMLRWANDNTRRDNITKEDTMREAYKNHVVTVLENQRQKWFDHWLRREHNHICVKSLSV